MTAEQIAELRRQKYNATIVYLRHIHSDLLVVRVRPDFPLPPHKPGQFTTLGLGYWEPRCAGCTEELLAAGEETKLARRSYSISHPVLDDEGVSLLGAGPDWLEFYIVLVRESEKPKPPALTPRLFLLGEGDRLHLGEKITGNFTLDPVRPNDTVLFLSTGTGEAPHNYMLWELLRRGHAGRILAACCVRYRRDLGYRDVHARLEQRHTQYTYLSLVTREPEVAGRKVYIQDLITSGELEEQLGRPLDAASTHVFLCGNPKMIGVPERDRASGELVYPQPPGVVEILERRDFRVDQPGHRVAGNIHYEKYW